MKHTYWDTNTLPIMIGDVVYVGRNQAPRDKVELMQRKLNGQYQLKVYLGDNK